MNIFDKSMTAQELQMHYFGVCIEIYNMLEQHFSGSIEFINLRRVYYRNYLLCVFWGEMSQKLAAKG